MINRIIKNATKKKQRESEDPVAELKRIIEEEEIKIVFQPVIDLGTQRIVAYEAFSRGPKNSSLQAPAELFKVARQNNLTLELDRVCFNKILEREKIIHKDTLLFINVEPELIFDSFKQRIIEKIDRPLKNIAIEMNPGCAVDMNTGCSALCTQLFLKALDVWQTHGFKISVDGIGIGYNALQLIGKVVPDFVKIDPSLIRNIDEEQTNKDFLKMSLTYADNIGVKLIAEGIETIGEFKTLREIGVKLGQGFLIHPPHHKPSRIVSLIDF